MSYDYSKPQSLALNQINDKGRTITVSIPSEDDVFDPTDFTFTQSDPTEISVKGLFTSFKKSDIDGTTIKADDKRVLIPASELSSPLENNCEITDNGTVYQVINTETLQPGDTPIIYMVQVRR